MLDLRNKNILLIAPSFFSYDIEIKHKLESYGAIVNLYDDRPSNHSIIKGIIRVNRNLIKPLIEKYYNKIIKNSGSVNYDIIFFTKGESITIKALQMLTNKYRDAKFVLYLWDSIENNKNPKIFNYFDRILSFDRQDCTNNTGFIFRPLFYIDYFKKIGEEKKQIFHFDFSFIGTVHSDRYFILKDIIKNCNNSETSFKVIMYLPSKLLFWFRKITEKRFSKVPYSDIEFNSIPFKEVTECFRFSKAIIDIQHPKQTGLTMRTIETLGAKKKLITTNKTVTEYDFYNSDNIHIMERDSPNIPLDFLISEYKELPDYIYKKYSIDGWINDCLGNI
ncbi:MAG TPA: lipopolysaccharide biosynthesis protein [Marinilabiliales bacterium]|jgi:hypothetical protein|nr:lipopolysaccharide biosynthesis protein [Marinilabiliales bacterium]